MIDRRLKSNGDYKRVIVLEGKLLQARCSIFQRVFLNAIKSFSID